MGISYGILSDYDMNLIAGHLCPQTKQNSQEK